MRNWTRKYKLLSGISLILHFVVVQTSAQLSPGDLAEPHSHLSGMSNCTKCHELGKKVSGKKCLDCHQEINYRIDENRGYHASVDVKGKECIECHSDHHGKNFQMIHFDTEGFDHALTGYRLQGSHAEINCRKCHKSEFISNREIKAKHSTYLGLNQECLSCHGDPHQGTLSYDCAGCHDFNAFKPASKFDHNKAKFVLRGKHLKVDCLLCHKKSMHNGKEMQKFTGLSYDRCTNCHKDIHNNKFGQNCTQCHSVVSFRQIKGMSNFDHSRTSYPLEGKHRSVSCTACHKGSYSKNLQHKLCSDCHTDYHNGEFMIEGNSSDCLECHSVLGFERSNYTIERHNKSTFQLTGAHLATPCFSCHKKNVRWAFREIGKTCKDCHKNIHESTLDQKYDPEPGCVNCHTSKRWNEIKFDHSLTGYKLEGAHLRQTCRSCHFRAGEEGLPVHQFSQLSSACTNCHHDVHQKQFEEASGMGCLKCHDYDDWKAGLFDHKQTTFPLDGKHKDVACNKCHPSVITAQLKYTQYKLKSIACESCH